MIYTAEKLQEITAQLRELTAQYADYDRLKAAYAPESADTVLWSKGHSEPFCCDYVTDLFDNTVEPRKLLKRPPRKREFTSMHEMQGTQPLHSVYFDKHGEAFLEKYYCNTPLQRIEVLFDTKRHSLQHLARTCFDEQGRPLTYDQTEIVTAHYQIIRSMTYTYENDRIIRAESIYEYEPGREMVLYDDPVFAGFDDTAFPPKRMNPPMMQTHTFHYTDDVLLTFTRTDHEYGKEYNNTWKIRRGVIKSYIECGIKSFGKGETHD